MTACALWTAMLAAAFGAAAGVGSMLLLIGVLLAATRRRFTRKGSAS